MIIYQPTCYVNVLTLTDRSRALKLEFYNILFSLVNKFIEKYSKISVFHPIYYYGAT